MNLKLIVRFLICLAAAIFLLLSLLPKAGIPKSHSLPPNVVYAGARGRATGVITKKYDKDVWNPLRSGEKTYYLDYRFAARAPAAPGVTRPGVPKTYNGTVVVNRELYDLVRIGQSAPVRYEVTHPEISGLDARQAGRSIRGGSALLSGWLVYAFAALCVSCVLMGLLERRWPHEG